MTISIEATAHAKQRGMKMKLCERLIRAFERRFGKSLLPLTIREKANGIWRVVDRETGSWADYELRGSRIRRIGELDNA